MRIYITHCSAKKDDDLKKSNLKVTPDKMYTSAFIKSFISRSIEMNVQWAIFSDLYGIWFPDIEHTWYDKHPDTVTENEFNELVKDFDEKLNSYDEVLFYYEPDHYHPFYDRLIQSTKSKEKVQKFTDLKLIK